MWLLASAGCSNSNSSDFHLYCGYVIFCVIHLISGNVLIVLLTGPLDQQHWLDHQIICTTNALGNALKFPLITYLRTHTNAHAPRTRRLSSSLSLFFSSFLLPWLYLVGTSKSQSGSIYNITEQNVC